MKSLLLVASLSGCTVSCIGAPFSFPQSTIDAGSTEVPAPDAGEEAETREASDAVAEAGPLDGQPDAPVAEASPDVAPDSPPDAPLCDPVIAQPHDLCPLEPSVGVFPQSYPRMAAPPPGGCPTIDSYQPTPPECRCAQTFNCACLTAHGLVPRQCKDLGGAPWTY